ncbi:Lar family restriction alleviation protein [Stutzerimonas stutzeri]|uniref:Lar family restriction alleviation protein n=1 Tax=Stutzerimonas stutzeri TaxID=316 RepID=UPI00220857FC|nr:Lar family restriction alleviation protein [Stutzerimonas stutzeri]UVO19548.1 Lar family restriction alleviation protein [Stutzerimonas stutzeri]
MSEELKPCPFCGSAAKLEDHRTIWAVRCECGCCVLGARAPEPESEMPADYWARFEKSAVDAWNRRAQPAEAEGVVGGSQRLMNTLAELARRAPLRTLHTICETQHQVSTVKLERYLEPIGDTLAGYAFTLRIDFDKLSAALSAVTAELENVREIQAETINARNSYQWELERVTAENDQLRAEVEALRPIHAMILNALDRDAEEGKTARGEMAAELRAALAAKEA